MGDEPMKLYISEGAVWLLVVFYLPLALFVLWQLWHHLPRSPLIRGVGVLAAAFIATAIPLWDVVDTSMQMARLCPQAGIKISRTVTVDGFYTNFGDTSHIDRGFKYVESVKPWNRVEIFTKIGNEIQKQVIDTEKKPYVPRSRYEFIYGSENGAFEGRRDIGIQKSIVRDRETKEDLGHALRFYAYPGWLDRNTIAQFGQLLWMCPSRDQSPDMQLMRDVLFPAR
jgi:hypothetical protein